MSPHGKDTPSWWSSLVATNEARGPDASQQSTIRIGYNQAKIHSSVLALQGVEITRQPIFTQDDRLQLLWNGEVFESQFEMDPSINDGQQLLSRIEQLSGIADEPRSVEDAFVEVLSSIEGPYAALLYDSLSSTLYFGRDPLGRRSLLQGSSDGTNFCLCSAASLETIQEGVRFSELDCSSLWKVKLNETNFEVEAVPRQITQHTKPFKLYELQELQGNGAPYTLKGAEQEVVLQFLSILSDSVRRRVCHIRPHGSSKEAQVAVLFSGGLDCCTLAMLAHMHLDPAQPIDLLNVAFENPRVLHANSKAGSLTAESKTFDVPDRKTGHQSFEELKRLSPNRQWNMVEVNVRHTDYLAEKSKIESLMEPCMSVMDLSIAAALYFACRGKGSEGYTSSAKVLLSGLGADELLGGYTRHRKMFILKGKQGLIEELQMDLDRLASRNLGRDDRILSSSGKEARYPYLSHSVITFLANLPIEAKLDYDTLPAGQGDKKLLRDVARHLGLQQTSTLVKRAIQFGARSAKMEMGAGRILGHEKLKS
ncbi:hypothetical protein CBS101457_002853 [Exobasidium rhododendri]|nr:hypothetical protein CBS101457_002853 [Exobasidium rhododendri]